MPIGLYEQLERVPSPTSLLYPWPSLGGALSGAVAAWEVPSPCLTTSWCCHNYAPVEPGSHKHAVGLW
jgi:hypothetical protein